MSVLLNSYRFGAAPPPPATPPAFQSITSPVPSFGAITASWGAGHAVDDVGLLIVSCNNPISEDLSGLGWANLGVIDEAPTDGTYRLQRAWWKRATSSAEPNIALADSGGVNGAVLLSVRGCRTSGAPVALLDQAYGVSATGFVLPSANTSGAQRFIAGILTLAFDSATGQMGAGYTNANLASLTNRLGNQSQASSGIGLYAFDGILAAAGAVGDTTANIATDGLNVVSTLFEFIP